jgi:hypothetical protein
VRKWREFGVDFLFAAESDQWLSILRVGLGVEVILYCLSIAGDWTSLLGGTGEGLISRELAETMLSNESPFVPRIGWLVTISHGLGLTEGAILNLVWIATLCAGMLLLTGIFCRAAAITSWFLHLAAAKSGDLSAYGVDNLVTIGLFYLMLSPLPDRLALDWYWRRRNLQDQQRLRFFRRVLQLHLCLIYFFGGLTKLLGVGWWNGTNLWRALTRPPFDVIPADVLIRFKHFFPIFGIAVFLLEIGYPIFIWHRHLQRAWLLGILGMHLAIGVAMGMYLFASVMIALNLAAFGPGILWRQTQPGNPGKERFTAATPCPLSYRPIYRLRSRTFC